MDDSRFDEITRKLAGGGTRRSVARGPGIAVLVAMLIALGTIGMGTHSASAAGTQIPFSGSFAGAAAADFANGTVTFNGTGIATHLGLSANDGHVQITGSVANASCFGGFEFPNVNTETLTAANGDSLTITMHDVACPISQFVFRGIGHWEVTGGTGRFSGATGQGTVDGGADFAQGVFSFQLTGTISAPMGS